MTAGARAILLMFLGAASLAGCGPSSSSESIAASSNGPGQPTSRTTPVKPTGKATVCTATVMGTSAADVARASEAVGEGVLCLLGGSYAEPMHASEPNQTWRLAPDSLVTGPLVIAAPGVTITGGVVQVTTDDPWHEAFVVAADDAVIQGVTFVTGGLGVSIKGVDGVRVVDNTFSGLAGTAIFVWGGEDGSDGVVIEGNVIMQHDSRRASPVASRGSDDGSVVNTNVIVRNNRIDQGTAEAGWFGIELKATPGALVEGNEVRGGSVLISLPDSDDAIIRDNLLDMRGSPHWGVEIASSDRVRVVGNEFRGRGRDAGQTAISMNSGSRDVLIQGNRVTAVSTLVDLTGDGHRVIANCLVDVARQYDYRSSAGRDLVFDNNGGC